MMKVLSRMSEYALRKSINMITTNIINLIVDNHFPAEW